MIRIKSITSTIYLNVHKVVNLLFLITTPPPPLSDDPLFLPRPLAKRLVKYTGYGSAAGLLMTQGLLGGGPSPGEANYSSDDGEGSDTEEYRKIEHKLVMCIEGFF